MIESGYRKSHKFDPKYFTNSTLKFASILFPINRNLTENDKEESNKIVSDVTDEFTSMFEDELPKSALNNRSELLAKLTARVLNKYYPLDKPRPEVFMINLYKFSYLN